MSEREPSSQPLRVPIPRQRSITRADIAGQFESIRGRRVILADASRAWHDWRAASEVEIRRSGFGAEAVPYPYVAVLPERAWWGRELRGEAPEPLWWPAGAVWVEGAEE